MTRSRAALHAVGWALAILLGTAAAQLRTLPSDAKRGWIRHQQDMVVTISGRPMQLAPGAQIRDASNRIVLPAALPSDALVKFTVDPAGHVNRPAGSAPLRRAPRAAAPRGLPRTAGLQGGA